ncbi:hypothetical protein FHS02_001177 [Massilia umbonata]|uniref:Uncharacterized protein n=1 Tax=Pseudoduganella umbonata TaxID=864828 RepID=A0A7W5HBC3_9BURK|nr:hypothetical protein [Pseudoduganella umbonata]
MEQGFLHVGINYCHKLLMRVHAALSVAIDRATLWVFLHIYSDMSDGNSVDILAGSR